MTLSTYLSMLSHQRPADSTSEHQFISDWIIPLGASQDDFGNLWVVVPTAEGEPPSILFSSHTDTVHFDEGPQRVVKGPDQLIRLHHKQPRVAKPSCLGADCTSGIYIMRQMILAKVPGIYVFHREEESGGKGSYWIASTYGKFLARSVSCAIAFDRKGTQDIITHQGPRTASQAFAQQLASLLSAPQHRFSPSPRGIFTDTRNYSHFIPECTNISVGYEHAHTEDETQNWPFLKWLTQRCIAAPWHTLRATRDPQEPEEDPLDLCYSRRGTYYTQGLSHYYRSGKSLWEDPQDHEPEQDPDHELWNKNVIAPGKA